MTEICLRTTEVGIECVCLVVDVSISFVTSICLVNGFTSIFNSQMLNQVSG